MVGSFFSSQPSNLILQNSNELRDTDTNSPLISPLLECGDLSNISNKQVSDIREKVQYYIDTQSRNGVQNVSVYFRDLNNGPWFGINEKDLFTPGSLLKVPLMISVYKEAMSDPNLLHKKLKYTGTEDYEQNITPELKIEPGKDYSVDDMVSYMIKYSDNDAADILFRSLNMKQLVDSYTELGVSPPANDQYTVSVKNYASFFRILYNATYLDHGYSQKALQLLTQTAFNQGIVAGVPNAITVAHKFGERGFENSSQKQLHDCGIVYYPNQPYLLCIMTRGNDFSTLEHVATDISRVIYQELSAE